MEFTINKGFSLILAADQKYGIGKEGQLPWPMLKKDMEFFVKVTTEQHSEDKIARPMFFQSEEEFEFSELPETNMKNAVVMGSKTWHSIPKKRRPFKNRINVVLTRDIQTFRNGLSVEDQTDPDVLVFDDMQTMFQELDSSPKVREIVVIGGAAITKECLSSFTESLKYIIFTRVNSTFD